MSKSLNYTRDEILWDIPYSRLLQEIHARKVLDGGTFEWTNIIGPSDDMIERFNKLKDDR